MATALPPPVPSPGPAPSASRSATLALVAAVVVGALLVAAPLPGGPAPAAQRAGALLVVALILWVSEAVPIAVTALLVLVLQPMLGLAPLGAAFASFMSPVFFFVLAMFVLTHAMAVSGLDRRFAGWLLARADGSTHRTLTLLMAGTAAVSTIVSDVPAAAVFMVAALGLFERMGLQPGSQFARGVMIGIPIASFIGGVGTPAGSSVNVLGLTFLEQYGKVRVPFVHWMAIGMPMVVLLVPLAAKVLLWCYPPEQRRIEGIDFAAEQRALGAMTPREWRVLVVVSVMLVLWIASSWVPRIDVVIVAVLGAVVLFLPGMRLFTSWKDVERATAWDTLLMIGGVTSLGAVSASSGLAKALVDGVLGGLTELPVAVVVAGISAFIALIHLIVPVNPAIVASMTPPIALLALSAGQNPALYGLPVVFSASCAFLLPLDAVTLVTYGKGYYRMFDMLLPGAILTVAWVVVLTALLLLISPWLGLL